MKSRFAMPAAVLLVAFSVSACASTADPSAVGQGLTATASSTAAAPSTTDSGADSALATVPDPAAATTTTVAPTTAATTTTTHAPAARPSTHPTTSRPAPKPTTAAPAPAATCIHHATIDEGTARCGAGEPHPSGAMAECWDSTYSYSQTPSGTCSHHQGVEVWYY